MNNQILSKLKEVQKVRGDLNAFASHDEFLPWSDVIPPLLEFDETLHKEFIFWSNHVKSAHRRGRDRHHALDECIGIVNKAIAKLEIQPLTEQKLEVSKKEIDYPSKVTLSWLYHNVPWSFWVWLFSLLVGAFSLGLATAETDFYKSLKPLPEKNLTSNGTGKNTRALAFSRA